MDVCSPSAVKSFSEDSTCFTKSALVKLATLWNKSSYATPVILIKSISSKSKFELWKCLDDRMKGTCEGSGREWCWVDKLGPAAKYSPVVAKNLRPAKPSEWYTKPYTWLSNYDIIAVMKQYEAERSNHYKFLGVLPIDFNLKDSDGQCLYSDICSLDIAKLARKGVKYVGLITNLDKHDEPGSHWTSTFVCIDPSMPCFGAYYYDSVSRTPPDDVKVFMKNVKTQALQLALPDSPAKFKMQYSKSREQDGNTECGMFSIVYQLRWLDELKANPAATFKQVLATKMTDSEVHKYRDRLFRPNTNVVLKHTKAKSKI